MLRLLVVFVAAVVASVVSTARSLDDDLFVEDFLVPGVRPTQHDEYVCTSKSLDTQREAYIVQIEAQAEAKRAHHVLLFGCSSLYYAHRHKASWNCNEGNVCYGMKILFAWAKNADPTYLPKDVGFRIGGTRSDIAHLVLQVHYAIPLPDEDRSGLRLHLTYRPQKYLAGILLMVATEAAIPPHSPSVAVDVNCMFRSDSPVHAFAFRVHAHTTGVVVSGFKVNKSDGKWMLLGKGNPQWPQAFYPMAQTVTILDGDVLASRCIFNSTSRNSTTYMGSTAGDEMCNFYVMYYGSASVNIDQQQCIDVQYPDVVRQMPSTAEEPLPPNPLLEEHALHQQHLQPHHLPIRKKGGAPSSSFTGDPDVPTRGHIHHHNHDEQETLPPPPSSNGTRAGSPKFLDWLFGDAAQRESMYVDVPEWPKQPVPNLGQVTSLAFDSAGNVVIFHRGSRVWGFGTFDLKNRFTDVQGGPIDVDTVLTFDKDSGSVVRSWGRNLFYMPHGLFVDHSDNVWVTDVAMHQVFKFAPNGSTEPLLTLGVRFEPDDDSLHFCKPSSVAVAATSGEFYVADGYCNSRILKYSARGELLLQWGRRTSSLLGYKLGVPPPYAFDIPHSLALAEDKGLILVADRENGRIQAFHTRNGTFHAQIRDQSFGGRLFAVAYSPVDGGTVYAVNGPSLGTRSSGVKGFVIALESRETLGYFTPSNTAMSNPHDIVATADGGVVYVAEIGPNRVWKFTLSSETARGSPDVNAVPSQASPASEVTAGAPPPPPTPQKPERRLGQEDAGSSTVAARRSTGTNFTASMIIMSLLAIPVLVVVFVTVFVRLRKRGTFYACNISHVKGWMTGYKNPNGGGGLGSFLGRGRERKGFDPVSVEDSDPGDGSDSDVEEFDASTAQKA